MEVFAAGILKTLLDANAVAAPVNGTTFCLPNPNSVKTLTWRTSFASAPSAVTVTLQGSLDGTNFFTIDSSTATAGEVKVKADVSCLFIRAQKTSQTDGGALTVEVVVTVG